MTASPAAAEFAPERVDRSLVVVLAGGQGKRAGGPKALKMVAGRPWWRLQCEAIATDGLAPVAVLHPDAWSCSEPPPSTPEQQPWAAPAPVMVVSSEPVEPAFHSLLRGLRALPSGQGAWVLPVDCPWPGAAVLHPLTPAIESDRFLAVIPIALTADGSWRGGHPVWLSAAAVHMLLGPAAGDPSHHRLDEWMRGHTDQVARIAVAENSVLANYNLDGISK